MMTVWIVVGVVVVAGIVFASVRYRRDQEPDLGAVSHQWVAEHRFGQGSDRQR